MSQVTLLGVVQQFLVLDQLGVSPPFVEGNALPGHRIELNLRVIRHIVTWIDVTQSRERANTLSSKKQP